MVPPLVEKALALTERLGFERSCRPEVGRLLHVLAASRGRERVAEIGTGTGVGAAWIVSALPPQTPFFTDGGRPRRAAAARSSSRPTRTSTCSRATGASCCRPRRRSTSSSTTRRSSCAREDGELVAGLLAPGGIAVLDDLTPGFAGPDPVREFWLGRSGPGRDGGLDDAGIRSDPGGSPIAATGFGRCR